MPRTFDAFLKRTRKVAIFPDTPDVLMVEYRPEAMNEQFLRAHRQMQRGQRQRARQIEKLTQQVDACEDEAERDRLEAERDQLEDAHAEQSAREGADELRRIIVSWDLYEDETRTRFMPITYETLTALGAQTLGVIAERVIADLQADPTKPPSSVNGSPAVVNEAPLSTGSFAS